MTQGMRHKEFYFENLLLRNYRQLAQAVIRLALTDLRHIDGACASAAENFFADTEYFEFWCDAAGVDYDVVKDCAEYFLYNGKVSV
ncbi:MAG: hypothetical protein LBC77_04455 [Spirochaetaceae bacterium]|jgi:hypothetical protein|nr:hypothetical protein [Spirochaetaceae bacterium]